MRDDPDRPHGRAEVMAAVQAVTVEMLAERGPRDVTIRDVAERAGVNHALVHRYFGSKEELFRAVFAGLSAQFQTDAAALGRGDVAALLNLLRENPAFWRILARSALDAPDMLADNPGPAAPMMLAMISGVRDPSDETRAAAAVAGSLALGWLAFGRHLSAVLELNDTAVFDAAVAEVVATALASARRVREPE
jgi:AcrR family transcriptional regulator